MKKIFTVILFAAMLMGLSVTASFAGPPDCLPGCPCPKTNDAQGLKNHGGWLGVIENHNNAMRVRQKAYGRQTVQMNDNGLGMTCFDRSIALTSRLGAIFSDVLPAGPFTAPNTSVFSPPSGLFSPSYGADKWLLQGLNTVVVPQVANHVDDFKESLSDVLGATNPNFFMTTLMGLFAAALAPITTAITNFTNYFTTFMTLINTFQTAMTALGLILGLPALGILIPTLMAAIKLAFNAIMSAINAIVGALQAALKAAADALLANFIMGPNTSVAGQSNGSTGECDRIQQLWGNSFPAGFQTGARRALTQTGRQAGTPYFSFADLLTKNPAGAGTLLTAELQNTTNASIITGALNDLGGGGALFGPGSTPLWPPGYTPPPPSGACDPTSGRPCGNSTQWLTTNIIGAMP
jgi:hypothetical protein